MIPSCTWLYLTDDSEWISIISALTNLLFVTFLAYFTKKFYFFFFIIPLMIFYSLLFTILCLFDLKLWDQLSSICWDICKRGNVDVVSKISHLLNKVMNMCLVSLLRFVYLLHLLLPKLFLLGCNMLTTSKKYIFIPTEKDPEKFIAEVKKHLTGGNNQQMFLKGNWNRHMGSCTRISVDISNCQQAICQHNGLRLMVPSKTIWLIR